MTILDAKTLTWQTDFEQGDLEVQLENFEIGEDPTVTIVNVGGVELVQSEVRWSICNGIVGICHSAGASDGLGPFQAISSDGGGLSIGDYLTLSVRAVDEDGWERESPEQMDILVPTIDDQETVIPDVEEDEGTKSDQQSGSGDSSLSSLEIILGILILMLFVGGGTMVGLYFSGAIGSREEESQKPPYSPSQLHTQTQQQEAPIDFEQAEEIHPPLPEGGLPSGWTMEQWKYYGEQWLERKN